MATVKIVPENFKLFRAPAFDDLEFAKVSHQTHVYPRHWNETYVIQVVEQGINECECRGATHRVSTGSILFINPHEIHTGCAAGATPLVYRSLYPTPELLIDVAAQYRDRNAPLPFFPALIAEDASLAKMFLNAHRACEAGADALTSQTLLLELLASILQRHAENRSALPALGNENLAVKRAKEYLTENFNANVSLAALAKIAYLSPFHLLRAFRKTVGLPPHEYVLNLRIQRAKHLLLQGRTLSDAAYETGFCDQSHFTRHFKRIMGIPPGRYLKKSNFVQNLSIDLQ
ncbi:MAG: AraC family transcriptional regulator [candidate division KSB1 bacterium]